MEENPDLAQTQFDTLLVWLADDREKAGEKYEEIRESLIRFFEIKGCHDVLTLTDETIHRVTSKISTLQLNSELKMTTLFFGFAKNVYFEYQRQKENQFTSDSQNFAAKVTDSAGSANSLYLDYLQECLETYSAADRELILDFYAKDKHEKVVQRRNLAKKLNLTAGTMNTRIYRIRLALQKCIENKLK